MVWEFIDDHAYTIVDIPGLGAASVAVPIWVLGTLSSGCVIRGDVLLDALRSMHLVFSMETSLASSVQRGRGL